MSCVGVSVCRRRTVPNKQKLRSLTVTKLRPTAKPYLVWDSYQRGLALQIQPSGYRAYKLIYRFHNRPRWYHLGAADSIGLSDARKLAAEVMLEVIRGKDPQAERKAQRTAGTFADVAERYREEYAKKRNKSWKQADWLVQKHLFPAWGKLDSKAIVRSDVRTLVGRIAGPSLANQVLACASAIFSWAVKQELVAANPCRGVERNETKSRERVLSDAEIPLFWNAFDETGLVSSSALKVLLLTGQRPGEVAHMRWEHLESGWWTMPGAPDGKGWPGTKNGETHRIWLPQAAREIIAELSDDDDKNTGRPLFSGHGFVFTSGRRAIAGLAAAMRQVCEQLGAERATPHDLRRTHGTRITELGFGREAMNRVQNHREGGIADVYDRHEYAEENKRLMEAVSLRVLALATGKAAAANVVQGQFPR
jgi:integrase